MTNIDNESLYIEKYNNIIWLALIFFFVSSVLKCLSKRHPLATFEPYFLLVSAIIYIGFRDYSIGIDTNTYLYIFNTLKINSDLPDSDKLFFGTWFFLSKFFDFRIILILCSIFYVYPVFLAFKKISDNYYILFLLFFLSPYFFQFSINGMRNGLAASVFILGLAYIYQQKGRYGWVILFLSAGIHSSMLLPLSIFLFAKHIKSASILVFIWICVLCLSLAGLVSLRSIAGNFLSYGGRIAYIFNYLIDTDTNKGVAVRNYFLYGIPPAVIGFWYIVRKRYDIFYIRIYKTYIIMSCFHLLVIEIRFAIRFAYLADFLMPIIIAYPLAKYYTGRIRFFYFGCILLFVFFIKSIVFT